MRGKMKFYNVHVSVTERVTRHRSVGVWAEDEDEAKQRVTDHPSMEGYDTMEIIGAEEGDA